MKKESKIKVKERKFSYFSLLLIYESENPPYVASKGRKPEQQRFKILAEKIQENSAKKKKKVSVKPKKKDKDEVEEESLEEEKEESDSLEDVDLSVYFEQRLSLEVNLI